jgi:hypothetical protein
MYVPWSFLSLPADLTPLFTSFFGQRHPAYVESPACNTQTLSAESRLNLPQQCTRYLSHATSLVYPQFWPLTMTIKQASAEVWDWDLSYFTSDIQHGHHALTHALVQVKVRIQAGNSRVVHGAPLPLMEVSRARMSGKSGFDSPRPNVSTTCSFSRPLPRLEVRSFNFVLYRSRRRLVSPQVRPSFVSSIQLGFSLPLVQE